MTRLNSLLLLITLLSSVSAAATSAAENMQDEVDYLFSVLGKDSCTFVRNDISYSSGEFERHLRSKLSGNEQLINSAEDFIEKIATRSSVSESPYVAICGAELQIIKDWLTESLEVYRRSN